MDRSSEEFWGARQRRLPGRATFFATLLAVFAIPAYGGDGVINVNQHLTQPYSPTPTDSCENPSSCGENQALPENALGQYSLVDANAYHVGAGTTGECKFAKVRCKYDDHSRPKIISSDDGYVPHADAEHYMQVIAGRSVGTYHYEYWDACLTDHAMHSFVIPNATGDPFPDADTCHDDYNLPAYGSQDMIEWIGNPANNVVSSGATMLLQNGWLHRDSSSQYLKWKAWNGTGFVDNAKRLMGFGYMGALGAGPDRLLAGPYMRALRFYNINFTRVWAMELWTALQTPEGPTPFPHVQDQDGYLYHLFEDNAVFYNHLRNFAQQAADRGIVVQLDLFDKHGLIYHQAHYRYKDSPYRDDNNNTVWDPDYQWLANIIDPCGNPSSEDPDLGPPSDGLEAANCHPLDTFATDADMQGVHRRFLRRVGEEVGGIGNMMFEIINEVLAPAGDESGDWPTDTPSPRLLLQHTTLNQAWQAEMAAQMKLALPLAGVARDAFNGYPSGRNLGNKHSDVQGIDWIPPTYGAQVKVSHTEGGGLGSDRLLGYVTSSQAQPFMVGTLALGTGQAWTKLHVRADLECLDGELRLGTGSQATGGDQVYVAFTCPESGTDLPWSLLRLYKKIGSQTTYLAAVGIDDPAGVHNVRLSIKSSGGSYSATVFVDGDRASNTVALGPIAGFTHAFFWGQVAGQNPYPEDAGMVDNFEAAVFCDDELRGCTP